ncbi:MAG: SAVMC3_10250 family protein [Stackebrandtia sp.]
MREFLYLSTGKLAAFMPDRRALRKPWLGRVEVAEAGIKVGFEQQAAEPMTLPWRDFKRVEKHVKNKSVDVAAAANVAPGQWFGFEADTFAQLPARWLGSDLVLFACTYPQAATPLAVLLCGSSRHLLRRDDTGPDVSAGSDIEWLDDMATEELTRSWRELSVSCGAADDVASAGSATTVARVAPSPVAEHLATGYVVHAMVTQARRTTVGRMRGYARTLLSGTVPAEGDRPQGRFVLGTPLHVEWAS